MKNTVAINTIFAALAWVLVWGCLAELGKADADSAVQLVGQDDHWTRQRQRDDKTREWQPHMPLNAAGLGGVAVFGWA
jgi:hypothetical protein